MFAQPIDEKAVFNIARRIDSREARADYLQQACGANPDALQRLVDLLQMHEPEHSFLESPADAFHATIDMPSELPIREKPGSQIGPYKLLQQIGEGGMGTVYMAEQAHPVQRKVALKVIKAGMGSSEVISRFEAERQALAMMDHVNIARVLDAGTTESGLPYFVMELVHGVPITKYCDDNHLTPRQRLELFVPVCQAIQHAHQKGIIHRDIKPSNVMVTLYDGKPVPKVIDFGVAKATEQKLTERTLFTHYGTMVGTLEYMSPEQAEMSGLGVDTRSDIYSLGVLLYELLTGSTPLSHKRVKQAAYAEILRMIKEEEPPRPSTRLSDSGEALASISAQRHMEPAKLSKLMRGELDWIVMKTLEKDRNRRYETANGFSLDVQRYLADETVQACPPSAWYGFRKFARRNKRMLATASAIVLALLLGITVSVRQAIRASEAEGLANANYEAAEANRLRAEASERDAKTKEGVAQDARTEAVESLQDALAAVDQMTRVAEERLVYVPQMESIRHDLLQDALKFYQKFLEKKTDDPVIRREAALAYHRMGRIHHTLTQEPEAENAYRKAIAMLENLGTSSPLEPSLRYRLVLMHIEFSWIFSALGRSDESVQSIRCAIEVAERLAENFPDMPDYREVLINARNQLASALIPVQPDEAEKIYRRNLLLADTPFILEGIHRGLGTVFMAQEHLPEAEEAYRQALKYVESMAAEAPSVNWVQGSLGYDLRLLAGVLAANQRPAEAEEYQRRAVLICEKLATDFPAGSGNRNGLATAQLEYAAILKQLGRTADAETAYRRALDLFEKLATEFPSYRETAIGQRYKLGQFLVEVGRTEDAVEVYRQAVDLLGKLPANVPATLNHSHELVRTHVELGRLFAKGGKTAEAEIAYRGAIEIHETLEKDFVGRPKVRLDLAQSHVQAANLLRDAGRPVEAEKLYRLALRSYQKLIADFPEVPDYRQALAYGLYNNLALLLQGNGQPAAAEEMFLQEIALHEQLAIQFPKVANWRSELISDYSLLAILLRKQDRLEDAEKAYRKAITVSEELTAEFPAHPSNYWHHYIDSHKRLDSLLRKAGRPREGEQASLRAVSQLEKLARKFPAEPNYRHELGGIYNWLGLERADAGKLPEAGQAHREAVRIYEELTQAAASIGRRQDTKSHRQELAWTYMKLASVLKTDKRLEEAVDAYRQALAQCEKLDADFPADATYRNWIAENYGSLFLVLAATKRQQEAEAMYGKLLEHSPKSASAYNIVAWILATSPDPKLRDPKRAVELAQKAIELKPEEGMIWNTLGAAHYRAGEWKDGITALMKSDELLKGELVSFNAYLLAMAHWQLDEKDRAHAWYNRAVQWMDKNEPTNDELRRFRSEAAELLGLPANPTLSPDETRQEAESLKKPD